MNTAFSLPFREPAPGPVPNRNRRILLIINPVSGRLKAKTGLFDILDRLYAEGDPAPAERVTVVLTTHRGHAAELAASALRESYDTVICCGGDGTLNETVSGLLSIPPEARPELGYIPAGSTNDLAASLGLPSSLREAAALAVNAPAFPYDVGYFSPADGYPARHFTYIASFGAFTAISYTTPQSVKNVMGHAAYLVEGVKDLANLQPRRARFALSDGRVFEDEYIFCAVTNTTSAAGIVQLPKDKVSFSDGRFELLLVKTPKNPADLNRILSAMVAVQPESCPLIEFCHTDGVSVTLEEPTSWSLDGEEAVCGREVKITCLPRAVCLRAMPQDI